MSEIADEVINKAPAQVCELLEKHWPEIEPLINEEGEVSVNFQTTITFKTTEPGEHADKSNRIKTTMSFSKRVTDSREAQLTKDTDQEELPLGKAKDEQVPV